MPVSLKHKFQSQVPDEADTSLVRPSNWNDEHALTAGAASLVGNPAGAAGDVAEVPLGAGLAFSGGSLVNNDRGSLAVAAHEAAADPHAQYTTAAEVTTAINGALTAAAADAAPGAVAAASALGTSTMFAREDHTHQGVTSVSVNGGAPQSGAVNITTPAAPLKATRSTVFVSTANNNTVQSVLTLVVPAASIVAGLALDIRLLGAQTNVATNGGQLNVLIRANGTTVAQATLVVGTAAQTNRAFRAIGGVTFLSATSVVGFVEGVITTAAAVSASNTAAPTTVAAGNVTIELAVQTATANAGNLVRVGVAFIKEV